MQLLLERGAAVNSIDEARRPVLCSVGVRGSGFVGSQRTPARQPLRLSQGESIAKAVASAGCVALRRGLDARCVFARRLLGSQFTMRPPLRANGVLQTPTGPADPDHVLTMY